MEVFKFVITRGLGLSSQIFYTPDAYVLTYEYAGRKPGCYTTWEYQYKIAEFEGNHPVQDNVIYELCNWPVNKDPFPALTKEGWQLNRIYICRIKDPSIQTRYQVGDDVVLEREYFMCSMMWMVVIMVVGLPLLCMFPWTSFGQQMLCPCAFDELQQPTALQYSTVRFTEKSVESI